MTTTTATTTTITLADLARCGVGIADMVGKATPLDPTRCHRAPILDETGDLVDGYHRTAGMLAWAREHEIDPATYSVTVVVCLDDELIQLVCDHGQEDADALDAIYDAI